ncbi:MAG: hypothetical protein QXV22_04435 [Thermoplasmataceae archaeon]
MELTQIVDFLMVEHSLIRGIGKCIAGEAGPEFSDFREYVKSCHIEIEEKLVFPVIIESLPESSLDVSVRVKQIQADHKLLLKLSENIDNWISQGNSRLLGERGPLYIRLLKEHNQNEDSFVFKLWPHADQDSNSKIKREAMAIIENFGLKRYLEITGISMELYEKFMEK